MLQTVLQGRRILVVEDEYLIADELRKELERAGAIAIGPVSTLKEGVAILEQGEDLDGVVLDLNLGGTMAFPLADLLLEMTIPVVFASECDASAIPSRYESIPFCEKPFDVGALYQAIC